jgi:ribosomal protein L35
MYEIHLKSKRHNDEPRKERIDKKYNPKCKYCDFTTIQPTNMSVHILTKHSSPEERKNKSKFYCEKCDFGTMGKILYKRHLETKKHTNDDNLE